MKSDRQQDYRTVASVIAQQYSSAIFVSLRFRSHMEKFGRSFKKYYYLIFLKLFF